MPANEIEARSAEVEAQGVSDPHCALTRSIRDSYVFPEGNHGFLSASDCLAVSPAAISR